MMMSSHKHTTVVPPVFDRDWDDISSGFSLFESRHKVPFLIWIWSKLVWIRWLQVIWSHFRIFITNEFRLIGIGQSWCYWHYWSVLISIATWGGGGLGFRQQRQQEQQEDVDQRESIIPQQTCCEDIINTSLNQLVDQTFIPKENQPILITQVNLVWSFEIWMWSLVWIRPGLDPV